MTVNTVHGEHSSQVTCNPGERLLFDDDNALSIQQGANSANYVWEVSDADAMLRELPPRPLNYRKKRVLFYRNRGTGDQLILSGIIRFFREALSCDARVLSDRVHEHLWAFNPFIGGVPLSTPLHLDAVYRAKGRPFFDAAFFIESASEWDTDSEQPNIYDRLYKFVGIDPERVSVKYKRPVFALSADDTERAHDFIKSTCDSPYIVVQLRAANKGRSLSHEASIAVLTALSDIAVKKNLSVLVTDDKPLQPEIVELIGELERTFNVAQRIPSIRLFGALIANAELVVGPDSSALHLAAASEIPAVGIWGPFDPDCRVKYYPRQAHIWHKELCANAPCYNFMPTLPAHKCPRGANQQSCECFAGVTSDDIFSACIEVLMK